MAELSRSSRYRATPTAPLSDDERNRLVERLNAAFESGDVDQDQYRSLLDRVFGARTLGDVAPVVEALPGAATYDVPAIVGTGAGRPGELAQPSQPKISTVAIVGGVAVLAVILAVALVLGGLLI